METIDSNISPEDFARLGAPRTVYIRPVLAADLTEDGVSVGEDQEFEADTLLYAVHAADGTRMAVLTDREAAFVAALQNDMTPVSVH
ncbi:MAG: DUF1150 family protein [Pseudomonadota bacterium]